MKLGKIAIICGIALITLALGGCGQETKAKPQQPKIYSVKVTSVKPNSDGDNLVIKGKTDAPKGTKVLAQSSDDDKDNNELGGTNGDDWAKVDSKGHFKGELDALNAINRTAGDDGDSKYKETDSAKIKFFASTGIKDKADSIAISKKVRKALAGKNISATKITIGKKAANYWNSIDDDLSSSESSSEKSSESSNKASSESSSKSSTDISEDTYEPVTYDQLARHPKQMLNEPIQFSAKVMQTEKEDGQLFVLAYMDDDPDETIMILIDGDDKPDSRILEDDVITVKGNPQGLQKYTTVFNVDREIPEVDANEKVVIAGHDSGY